MTTNVKSPALIAVLAGLLLAATAPAARAGESHWLGKDEDGVSWSLTYQGGDDYLLKKNGRDYVRYQAVSKATDHIELQVKGTRKFDRIRVYADRITINESDSTIRFHTLAKGKWR